MNPRAYLSRFIPAEGATALSETEFLAILAGLNEAEWCDLISLVLSDGTPAYAVFLPPRGERLLSYAAALIDRLGSDDRKLAARALERVANQALQKGEMSFVYDALFLAGLFGDPATLSFLRSLVLSDSPSEVRERAANALTNHAHAVPPQFWRQLDVASNPFLLGAAVIGLSEYAPAEAIAVAGSAANEAAAATLQYPIQLAVEKLLVTQDGLVQLHEAMRQASGPVAGVLRFVLDSVGGMPEGALPLTAAEQFAKRMGLPIESAREYEFNLVVPNIAHYLRAINGSIRDKARKDVEEKLSFELAKVPSDRALPTAIRLGKEISAIKIEHKLGDRDIEKHLWPALVNSSERSHVHVGDLFPFHCMRLEVCSYASAKLKLTDEKLFQCIYGLRDLSPEAKRVKEAAPRDKLSVATSLFHEDQIFAALLNVLLNRAGYYGLEFLPRDWGTLFTRTVEADFGFVSEFDDESVSHLFGGDSFPSIYRFLGYYVFARRAWLESLSSSGIAKERKIAQNILKPRSGKKASRSAINERAWLVRNKVDLALNAVAKAPGAAFAEETIEQEFERFISGQSDVFLGGAVQARLIQRWWCSEEVPRAIEVLNPNDVGMLSGKKVTRNGLLFKDELRKKKYRPFRLALARLYKGIASLLTAAVKTPGSQAQSLLGHLTAILAEADSQGDENSTKWAFVSDPEDLRVLLGHDNAFDTKDLKDIDIGGSAGRTSRRSKLAVLPKPRARA
jgi:hypothetical protein